MHPASRDRALDVVGKLKRLLSFLSTSQKKSAPAFVRSRPQQAHREPRNRGRTLGRKRSARNPPSPNDLIPVTNKLAARQVSVDNAAQGPETPRNAASEADYTASGGRGATHRSGPGARSVHSGRSEDAGRAVNIHGQGFGRVKMHETTHDEERKRVKIVSCLRASATLSGASQAAVERPGMFAHSAWISIRAGYASQRRDK